MRDKTRDKRPLGFVPAYAGTIGTGFQRDNQRTNRDKRGQGTRDTAYIVCCPSVPRIVPSFKARRQEGAA